MKLGEKTKIYTEGMKVVTMLLAMLDTGTYTVNKMTE
jgi:hypothetical protein